MTPLTTVVAGIQVIVSWIMSAVALLAIFVSVIVCLACVDLVFERRALARAYTVKINSSDRDGSPARNRSKMSSSHFGS